MSSGSEDPTLKGAIEATQATPVASGVGVFDLDLPRGTSLGRYVVLDKLGRGGMGVVYAGYDPTLNRRVAIKLLWHASNTDTEGRGRLVREAQAMARLVHPNVVTVHDVGNYEGRVFVAMEFVDGKTATQWVGEDTRSWMDVLGVYRSAGRGLAAAHRAGLVHRDFKPDNVMVADDGRVLVMDFGLAREEAEADVGDAGEFASDISIEASERLTQTGALMGTPAYMAPEQLEQLTADAKSDQFAFCVALYEGLYGERPFGGDSLASLAFAARLNRLRPAPDGSSVPGWLREVVARGLQADADERHPSMDALLSELDRDPKRARRLWAFGIGIVAAMGAMLFVGERLAGSRAALCGAGADTVARHWNDGLRADLRVSFEATNMSYAAAEWDRVDIVLDDYFAQWIAGYTDACEDTHVRGEQSQARLDARMGCLQSRLDEVSALLGELATADVDLVARSMSAVRALPAIATCEDTRVDVGRVQDPDVQAQIQQVRASLAAAKAKNHAGRYAAGLESIARAFETLGELDDAPLRAEILMVRGQLENHDGNSDAAEQTLREALRVAAPAGARRVLGESWLELLHVVGSIQARPKDALPLVLPAEIAVSELGDPGLEGRLLDQVAGIHQVAGNYEEARKYHLRAIAAAVTDEDVAVRRSNYGLTLFELGEFEQAREQTQLALDADRKVFGDGHPQLATTVSNLARAYSRLADYERSRDLYLESLAIREQTLGNDHQRVGDSLLNLAVVNYTQGKFEKSREQAERALKIWEATLGPDHPHVAVAHNTLGNLDTEADRFEDALAHYERVEAIYRARFEPGHLRMATPLNNQALVLILMEEYEQALERLNRGLEITEKAVGPDHYDVAYSLVSIGRALMGLGRHKEAIAPLERALKIREASHREPAHMSLTHYTLAQALWDGGGDRKRAIELARQAYSEFVETGIEAPEHLGELATWLRERGSSPRLRDAG